MSPNPLKNLAPNSLDLKNSSSWSGIVFRRIFRKKKQMKKY